MSTLETNIRKQKAKNKALKDSGQPQKVYNLIHEDTVPDSEPSGKPVGICATCGKQFAHTYSADRNAYDNYKQCPDCRKKAAEKKSGALSDKEREVTAATLPFAPHPWQQEVMDAFEKHRFVVLACGNRAGKDRATIMTGIKYFVECLNENRAIDDPNLVPPVLWWQIAPTEKMAKQNWRELKQYFPKQWVVAVSDSNFQMETIGGGIIEVRSGYSPDDLVGVGLDLVTITEAARFKDLHTAWSNLEARLNSPGRGRKKDRGGKAYGQGKAIINSSPIGKNDFYTLFCYGQKDHPEYSSNWWSCQYPWTCNPINKELAESIVHTRYGDVTYEETIRRQLGDRVFRSNYLADFLAEDGTVFKNFEETCVMNICLGPDYIKPAKRAEFSKDWKTPKPFNHYIVGYDPATGSSDDTPAVVVRCVDDGHVVRALDLYGKKYEEQWDYIAKVCQYYNNAPVHFLRTGHTAIEGQFEKRGIEEVPLDEQGGKKAALVQNLELVVENGDLKVLNDGNDPVITTLIYEMNDYTEKNGKYSNDKQPHDDFVSALYAAFSDYDVQEIPLEYTSLMSGVMRKEDFQ